MRNITVKTSMHSKQEDEDRFNFFFHSSRSRSEMGKCSQMLHRLDVCLFFFLFSLQTYIKDSQIADDTNR